MQIMLLSVMAENPLDVVVHNSGAAPWWQPLLVAFFPAVLAAFVAGFFGLKNSRETKESAEKLSAEGLKNAEEIARQNNDLARQINERNIEHDREKIKLEIERERTKTVREKTEDVCRIMMRACLLFFKAYPKKTKGETQLVRDISKIEEMRQRFNELFSALDEEMDAIYMYASKEVRSKFRNFYDEFTVFYPDKYLNVSVPDEEVLAEIIRINQIACDVYSVIQIFQGNCDAESDASSTADVNLSDVPELLKST